MVGMAIGALLCVRRTAMFDKQGAVLLGATLSIFCNIMLPASTAMMADVSEIRKIQIGEVRDGGYSAVFSLAMRMAISFSLMAGGCLTGTGHPVPSR